MKNFIAKFLKKKVVLGAALALATIGLAGAASVAQFGPDRPTKAYVQGMPGFDHVTFNSFTGVPNIGDERNFLTGKIATAPDGFYDPMNQVREGNELLVRVYVHNNADPSLNAGGTGVAKNTKVRAEVPTNLAQVHQTKAFITADNAQPKEITDTLDINAAYPFEMDYVEGSARLTSNFVSDLPLSDSLVSTGVLIGDDKLDGNVNGCFEYVALITYKIKIKAPNFDMKKTVRLSGEDSTKWREQAAAQPGGIVEWKLEFNNTGSTQLNNVDIHDQLPAKMNIVPGTTKIYNSKVPAGVGAGSDNVVVNGIDVGDYAPKSNAIVVFQAKVPEVKDLACGVNTFLNKGYATPEGQATATDNASVVVTKDNCAPPVTPTYSCDLLTAQKLTGRSVKFTTDASAAGGASIVKYIYTYGDGATEEVAAPNNVANHTYTKDGSFSAKVQVVVLVNGKNVTVDGAKCATNVTFNTPVTPKFSCDSLKAEKQTGRTVKFTGAATATGGATVSQYIFDLGDGNTNTTNSNVTTHTYANDGTYTVNLKVEFLVDGKTVSDNGPECSVTVKFETPNPEVPVYTCDSLKADKLGDRKVKFTGAATAKNGAVIANYIYNFGDSATATTNNNMVEHTYAKDGTYTASLKVEFIVDGKTVSKDGKQCEVTVNFDTPEEPKKPVFSCDLLSVAKTGGRTVKLTADATAKNGATIKRYVYSFGDGGEQTTDKNVVEHTYAKDGKYVVRVKVQVAVDNQTVTAEDDKCAAVVEFTTPTTPETPTTPGKLPDTGPGAIAAAFAAVSGVGSLGFSLITRRRRN